MFFDEIDPAEVPDLYTQCHVGLIALDSRHSSHNIPGKFLTYLQSGLPVLAVVNSGNDLAKLIIDERVGQVCESHDLVDLTAKIEQLIIDLDVDKNISKRASDLFYREFSVKKTVNQVTLALGLRS